MVVMGVDPGTLCTGYGVVEKRGNELHLVTYGVLKTGRQKELGVRLREIYEGLTEVIRNRRPEAVALEKAFYSKSVSSAMRIGEARAVAILCAAQARVPLAEYAPALVKKAVVGNGAAHKAQVQRMVRILLRLKTDPEPMDASDALAIAICHFHRSDAQRALAHR